MSLCTLKEYHKYIRKASIEKMQKIVNKMNNLKEITIKTNLLIEDSLSEIKELIYEIEPDLEKIKRG